ncbi:MAG: site-specific DNA-methyltransferase [Promethearchaeota archaeon]
MDVGRVVTLERIAKLCGEDFCLEVVVPEVLECGIQLAEWEALLDVRVEAASDLRTPESGGWLPLPVDTRYFPAEFGGALLDRIASYRESGGINDLLDGWVFHGDNLAVMRAILPDFKRLVQCVYIDPPYNTGGAGAGSGLPFGYDDSFTHEEWVEMMRPRLELARELMRDDGVLFISIDDNERARLELLLGEVFGAGASFGPVVVQVNRGGRDYLPIAKTHEYILCSGSGRAEPRVGEVPKDDKAMREYRHEDSRGRFLVRELRNRNPKFHRGNRPNLHYPVYAAPSLADAGGFCPVSLEPTDDHTVEVLPRDSRGRDDAWRWGKEKLAAHSRPRDPDASDVVARRRRDGGWNLYEKYRKTTTKPKSIWLDPAFRTEAGTITLRELFGDSSVHAFPKPVALIERCVLIGTPACGGVPSRESAPDTAVPDTTARPLVLDFFAGTGTTAHAVLEANCKDGARRRFILVEQAGFLDTLLVPRLKKVAYSRQWRGGKPLEGTGGTGAGIFFQIGASG